MITTLLSKIFGTQNDRDLKRMRPLVQRINQLEDGMLALTDEQLTAKTNEFRQRCSNGETLDSLLAEAFAVVRETSRRKRNERHYDVQLIGGIVLHEGRVAEMRTGEGKTLVATLPLYLNSLSGKGAHLVTVNDYLARRDAEWMSEIYQHLGLEVGIIQNSLSDAERKKAYGADITYGTNNEFGFDYLRDNMKFDLADYVQRELNYVIVDECDSILIDEARTPLIISGPAEKGSELYGIADRAVAALSREADYEIDEKARSVHLTEQGTDKIERALNVHNLYAPENVQTVHHVQQALKAHTLFKRDVEYVVRDGEVLIVDEFTGRILPGRRYSDGLHQAIEAKEHVTIERENQTLASITLQNYFRLYSKIAGMTGTAETEAAELHKIYKLGVTVIPTHRQIQRRDEADIVFLGRDDKFKAVTDDIKACHKSGQPVLVGTISIENSEYISYLLNKDGVPHNVLNAKQHEREADIVKEAGEKGRVTIATNMAGRGTDIKLGEGVRELGGLRIIGTERHESRRIDNQLRGRAGRQGDPGSSKFYLSLEDDLMRIFGGERMKKTMERLGMKPGESIEHKMVSRSIQKAQEKVEKHNFEIRKHLLEYDDVLNQQRTIIYRYRREILEGSEQLVSFVKEVINDVVADVCALYLPSRTVDAAAYGELVEQLKNLTTLDSSYFEHDAALLKDAAALQNAIVERLIYTYEQGHAQIPAEVRDRAEKWVLLETVDHAWKLHLQNIDHLKDGIGLRGYGYKNPLVEYKRESFNEFERMMHQIRWDVVERIFKMRPDEQTLATIQAIEAAKERELEALKLTGTGDNTESKTVTRNADKVGRNEPCPCASGKKYKQCCGKND